MKQRLIVEGKDDRYLIGNLMGKRNMSRPQGFINNDEFLTDFFIESKSINEIPKVIKELLIDESLTNLGIVLDANDKGASSRFEMLKNIIESGLEVKLENDLSSNGYVETFSFSVQSLTIGIFIMPDNEKNGYLEHFAENLISKDDAVLKYTKEVISDFKQKEFATIKDSSIQKNIVHTYLSLQEKPGLTLGLATQNSYFDANSPNAQPFIDWFSNTFE